MKLWLRIIFGIAIATAMLSATTASRAQGTSQTPAPTEGRLTDPAPDLPRGTNLPPNWLADDQFLRWPYPPGDVAYTDLDGFRIKAMINEITAISRKSRDDGNQYLGPHCRHCVRTHDQRMDGGAVPSHRARTGAHPGGRPATAVVPDVVGDDGQRRRARPSRLATAFPLFNSVPTNGTAQPRAGMARHGNGRRLCRPQRLGQGCRSVWFSQSGRPRKHCPDTGRSATRR